MQSDAILLTMLFLVAVVVAMGLGVLFAWLAIDRKAARAVEAESAKTMADTVESLAISNARLVNALATAGDHAATLERMRIEHEAEVEVARAGGGGEIVRPIAFPRRRPEPKPPEAQYLPGAD